nr:partner and localizer of BRCA2 [Pseudochaenichthys georgianus]
MDAAGWPLPSEQKAEPCGDNMPFDEQLRTTLHCDDKEKLRRKLALLQREYLKTTQRLQRAERVDAVRKHVRSRISQQNQGDPDVTSNARLSPSPLILNATNGAATSEAQCEGHTGGESVSPCITTQNNMLSMHLDMSTSVNSFYVLYILPHRLLPFLPIRHHSEHQPCFVCHNSSTFSIVFPGSVDSDNSRRSQVIRFRLPSEDPCTEALTPSHDTPGGHRSSPALRLRSRRSRLRWERRSAEAGRSTDDNSEEGQEQSERMAVGSEGGGKTRGTEVVNEGEELCSGTESESPSLLLTHWNTTQNETGDIEGNQIHGQPEQRGKETELRSEGKKESTSLVPSPAGREVNGAEQRNTRLCENSSDKDNEHNSAEKTETEKSLENTAEFKKEKSEMVVSGHDVKAASFLDSCTLVEGLLFPAEYYVRTTRRMTQSQSQPNMQAIILSQLSAGRRCSSRGRGGRGLNRDTPNPDRSDQHTASVAPCLDSQPAEPNTQSSSEISPIVTSARPARGRRKKRGRGRGRPQTPRCSLSLDSNQLGLAQKTADDPPATSSPVDSSPSLHEADGSKPSISPVQDVPQPASTNSTDTPPSSGVIVDPSGSASGPLGKVFPIFRTSGERSNRSTQSSRDAASWQCLLLPSSPPAQPSLLPLPSLSPGSLFNYFDTIQDFHLPDGQFAFLKLHKLRQVSVASGVEPFTSLSYNTRRSSRRLVSGDSERRLPLPLSLTPTIRKSPHTAAASHSDVCIKYSQSFTEDPECQSCTTATVSEPGVQDGAGDCVDQYKKQASILLNTRHTVEPQPHISFADRPVEVNNDDIGCSDELQIKESSLLLYEEQTVSPGVIHPLEEHVSTHNQTEDKDTIETLSFHCSLQETPKEPSRSRADEQLWNVSEAPGESPVQNLHEKSPTQDSRESPRAGSMGNQHKCVQPHSSQLLLSPALTSAPFVTLPPPSSALLPSPTLPSLGLTPRLTPRLLPSSPSAPPLTLPRPHSPSIQALSHPALSPCPSQIHQIPASSEPPCTDSRAQRVEAPPCRTVSGILPQGSGGRAETAEEHVTRCTHTLKAPAGGCLVDACLLRGSSGGLCVAAAGKWAVCLWSQTAASDWSLTHTWAFNEPVIDVFPVPDAAGLMCVTLGQLEIREVRMLSCCSLSQLLLCDGVVQAVVCVSRSRVVTSSHSASGSSLQVFPLSGSGSTSGPQPLVSPGVCVGALAAVAGLPDALIGSDESGRLFVWNLKTGQLLQRIILGEDLSHMACLRGYSYCGVLFVLLQHQLLSSLEEEVKEKDEESKNMALFSLVAINPMNGKSTLATRLYPPNAWCGRLCEADISGSSVVGLSQSGCVCVWQLWPRGPSRMLPAPESEGWQLARWGGEGTLLTGHHNGDVTLHCYSQTSLYHQQDFLKI